jgi:hypothetical protein
VAKDAGGSPDVSFFDGFGLTGFAPASKYISAAKPMFVQLGFADPSTELRGVEIAGIARSDVSQVSITRADEGETNVDLAPTDGYLFLAFTTSDPASFPKVVRAYGSNGALLSEQTVNTEPLCPKDNPHCL